MTSVMMMNQSVFMRIRENIQQNFSQNACCPHGFWPTKVIVKKFQIPYSFLSPECSLLSSGSAACKWYTSPSPFRPSYQVNVMLCHHHKPPIPLIYFFKPRTTHHFVVSSYPPCSHTNTIYTLTLDGILPFSSPIPAAWFFFCSCFLRVFLEAGILFVVLKL